MIVAVFVLVPALTVAAFWVGHHAGVNAGRFDEQFKTQRANGQFKACDAELNALKVKHGQTLMELEDALRVAAVHALHK